MRRFILCLLLLTMTVSAVGCSLDDLQKQYGSGYDEGKARIKKR